MPLQFQVVHDVTEIKSDVNYERFIIEKPYFLFHPLKNKNTDSQTTEFRHKGCTWNEVQNSKKKKLKTHNTLTIHIIICKIELKISQNHSDSTLRTSKGPYRVAKLKIVST